MNAEDEDEHNGNHLGCILLFRLRESTPISSHSLETLRSLRHFIIFLFSNLVLSQRQQEEVEPFVWITNDIAEELGLTSREWEVFVLRLMGLQRKTIADRLFLSEETIRKHTQKILRKAKAHSFIELFMRYYVPGLEDFSDPRFGEIHNPKPSARNKTQKHHGSERAPKTTQHHLLVW